MARLAILLLSVLAWAAVATAATPAEGTVSPEATKAKWTGTVTDPIGIAYAAAKAGGTADVCATPVPACDTYTLKVTGEGALRLTFTVTAEAQDDWVGLSVTNPAGEERMAFDDAAAAKLIVEKPAPGAYTVRVLASPADSGEVAYAGVATLEPAPPPPPPSPPPPPPAPPGQTPATNTDKPAPPPVQAGPRELAIEPDVRRVALAVRKGFRVRVVCRGGCDTVRLRVFVSSLTARTYRLANPKGDIRVGGARLLRDAEGRRKTKLTFKRSYRKKLARAKNLTLAVEAVARDPDGRVRTALKRLVLRR